MYVLHMYIGELLNWLKDERVNTEYQWIMVPIVLNYSRAIILDRSYPFNSYTHILIPSSTYRLY
jgi:hypothetical protein